MNQLLIVLDAVPYNVFRKAKTSNMRKIGEIGYAYSPAQWTLPSVISMFHIPYYLGKPIVIVEHYNHREWLPIQLKNGGYKTSIVVDNPWFVRYRDFIGRGFDNYIAMNSISAKSILNKGKNFSGSLMSSRTRLYLSVLSRSPGASELIVSSFKANLLRERIFVLILAFLSYRWDCVAPYQIL